MFFSKKLKKFNTINHCFSSRNGGVSQGIYRSLNCGLGSDDKKENILKNLDIVSKKIGINPENLFTMNQTHGNKVVVINDTNKHIQRVNSDALVTNQKNIAISVLTADCVPILIYDEVNQIIASIHAGWKGAYSNIVKNVVKFMLKRGCAPETMTAVIGPCISMKNYEVKKDFIKKFLTKDKKNHIFFRKIKKKTYYNLNKFIYF